MVGGQLHGELNPSRVNLDQFIQLMLPGFHGPQPRSLGHAIHPITTPFHNGPH